MVQLRQGVDIFVECDCTVGSRQGTLKCSKNDNVRYQVAGHEDTLHVPSGQNVRRASQSNFEHLNRYVNALTAAPEHLLWIRLVNFVSKIEENIKLGS